MPLFCRQADEVEVAQELEWDDVANAVSPPVARGVAKVARVSELVV